MKYLSVFSNDSTDRKNLDLYLRSIDNIVKLEDDQAIQSYLKEYQEYMVLFMQDVTIMLPKYQGKDVDLVIGASVQTCKAFIRLFKGIKDSVRSSILSFLYKVMNFCVNRKKVNSQILHF